MLNSGKDDEIQHITREVLTMTLGTFLTVVK